MPVYAACVMTKEKKLADDAWKKAGARSAGSWLSFLGDAQICRFLSATGCRIMLASKRLVTFEVVQCTNGEMPRDRSCLVHPLFVSIFAL